jgi:DNA methylase
MNQMTLFGSSREKQKSFLGSVLAFQEFGKATETHSAEGIPYLVNEFWTAGQRQAHSIHEISYRACFKAQLPEFFIERLTKPNDVVYDPFMGRGTTPVQASLMGRIPFGNDVNPLSKMLTRPRLRAPELTNIRSALQSIDWSKGEIEREDLFAFYHPKTLRKLEALRAWLKLQIEPTDPNPNMVADWIRMVAINRLSGHSPGFFSGRSMPPNQAVSVKSQIKINEKLGINPPERDVAEIIYKKSRTLFSDGHPPIAGTINLISGSADSSGAIADETVDLVVTSPPFLDIVQYASDNWLRCWFAGIEPDSIEISMCKTETEWCAMVRKTLAELCRVLKSGAHIAFEVGEVRNGTVLLEKLVWEAAIGLPLQRVAVLINSQDFTKTANCWGVVNGKKGTNTNRIVVLRKH